MQTVVDGGIDQGDVRVDFRLDDIDPDDCIIFRYSDACSAGYVPDNNPAAQSSTVQAVSGGTKTNQSTGATIKSWLNSFLH